MNKFLRSSRLETLFLAALAAQAPTPDSPVAPARSVAPPPPPLIPTYPKDASTLPTTSAYWAPRPAPSRRRR